MFVATDRQCIVRTLSTGILVVLLGSSAVWAQSYVETNDPEFPRVRYEDDSVSENDRCIVRLNKLNRRVPPVYVNGRPIGFC